MAGRSELTEDMVDEVKKNLVSTTSDNHSTSQKQKAQEK
jgi:hypothetical protein